MGKIVYELLKKKDIASIGVGGMIIFIAIVLIAGVAASVFIQTSNTLESQASATGMETTIEVSAGITVSRIDGYAATGADISKLAIMVKTRAGSEEIDLNHAFMELSNTNKKVVLNYTTSYYSKPNGLSNIFAASVFPDNGGTGDAVQFGILVLEDIDNSLSATNPLMNRGDKLYLCINATGTFSDIAANSVIQGMVVPESGAPGLIKFKTPSSYFDNVIELY